MSGIDVALVGREEKGDENLALRYLGAALAQAGHRPHVIPLCGPESLAPAADAVRGRAGHGGDVRLEVRAARSGCVAFPRGGDPPAAGRLGSIRRERVRARRRGQPGHGAAGFTLLLAPAAGCYGSHGENAGDTGTEVGDGGGDAADDGRGDSAEAVEEAGGDAELGDGLDDDAGLDGGCTPEQSAVEYSRARAALRSAPCLPCVEPDGTVPYGIAIDAAGRVVDVLSGDGSPVPDVVRACYLEALGGETFPCLDGEDIRQECVICIF